MNKNVESHFSDLPNIGIRRSIFDFSHGHKTSFNAGELIPVCCVEVLPGDTFKVVTSKVVRMQTLLTPILDNVQLETRWFFEPARLTWNHWNEFMGENTESAWVQQTEYQVPTISAPEGGFETGSLADYFGLPIGVEWSASDALAPIALPFRAYADICNDFWRDQNLTDPLNIPLGDANQIGSNGNDYINDIANGGKPFKVARYHDYFSSALPSPLKAVDPVSVRVDYSDGFAPVFARDQFIDGYDDPSNFVAGKYRTSNSYASVINSGAFNVSGIITPDNSQNINPLSPINLWADVGSLSGDITINDLRMAFMTQRFLERQAVGGTRYIEILKSMFDVTSPDSRLQRPEYLGGNRIPIAIHEVANSAQSEKDFLGDLGAMSATSDVHYDFEHSFTEHGYLLCLICARYDVSYSQGLDQMWTRKKLLDYYWPIFANLGEMPVYSAELMATSENIANKDIFGYQEAWASYRYSRDYVTGEMRPGIENTLASWHLADYYAEVPTLSDEWIRVDKSNIDRVLAVGSEVSNQFFADFYFQMTVTRPMPMFSIPGINEHF